MLLPVYIVYLSAMSVFTFAAYAIDKRKKMLLPIYTAYLIVISVFTFFLYVIDKSKAKKNRWRIREKTLLCASFFGGAIGGYLAMRTCRHKTKRWYFHAVNITGIVWQIALLAYLITQNV